MSIPNYNEPRRDASKDRATFIANQHNQYNPSSKGGIYSLEQAIASSEPPYLKSVVNEESTTSDSEVNKVVGELPESDIVNRIDPNIVESPKEVVHKAKEAQAYADLVSSIYSQADYEADEKKKKAAQWITAAQMLGDSIAALGNSYFTAKGANAMTLSNGSQKAAEATYKLNEDIRNARERAAKTKYELEKARKEWEYRVKQDELARKERKEAAARAQDNADRTFEYNKAKDTQSRLDTQARQAVLDEQWQKNYDLQKQREYRLGKDANKPEMFLLDEGWVSVPKEKWTDTEVAAVYAKIPEEIRESIEKVITEKGEGYMKESTSKSIKPTPQQMRQWIGEYKHLPEVANAIRRLAGVEVEEITNDEFGTGGGRGASAAPSNVQTGKEVTSNKDGRIKVDLSKL